MTTAVADKWILVFGPEDSVSDVAARTLRARVAAVQHYLPLGVGFATPSV